MSTVLHLPVAFHSPGNITELYKCPCGHLSPQIFFRDFDQALVYAKWYHRLCSCKLSNFADCFFTSAWRRSLFPQRKLGVRSNNERSLQMKFCREMLDRSNSDSPLGMRLFEKLQTQCDPSTHCQAAGFQGDCKAGERRTGSGYNVTKLAILTKLPQCVRVNTLHIASL